jgi:UDPglucose 6-dehydrogenase
MTNPTSALNNIALSPTFWEVAMKVAVVGTGYVGLVTGTCLAEVGNTVTCVDIDERKISNLKDGVLPIYEPGLEPLVKSNFESGRLSFSTDLKSAVTQNDIIMIAVGTPPQEDGSADVQHVLTVARQIGSHMNGYKVVVTKSTVPVGTADMVSAEISASLKKRGETLQFSVASNPEFLKEGAAVADFMKPDRIVIGCSDDKAKKTLTKLYAHFVKNGFQLFAMDLRSAELCKYASNAMLATKISFMNELSRVAENLGADISQVRQGMGADQRIGYQFTHPGIGYGGSCFPKDVKALIATAKKTGLNPVLMDAVEEVNKTQRQRFIDRITQHHKGNLKNKKFAVWGLSFKPETDDIREAPSIDVVQALLAHGAKVAGFDPVAAKHFLQEFEGQPGLSIAKTQYEALQDADALIICTEWKPFRSPDFAKMKTLMKTPLIFDGRNQYDLDVMAEHGFKYFCVGRPIVG